MNELQLQSYAANRSILHQSRPEGIEPQWHTSISILITCLRGSQGGLFPWISFWIPGWRWCYPKHFLQSQHKCKWANPATQVYSKPLLTSWPLKLTEKGKSHGQAQGDEEVHPSHHGATNTGEWRVRTNNPITILSIRDHIPIKYYLLKPKLFWSYWRRGGIYFSLMQVLLVQAGNDVGRRLWAGLKGHVCNVSGLSLELPCPLHIHSLGDLI